MAEIPLSLSSPTEVARSGAAAVWSNLANIFGAGYASCASFLPGSKGRYCRIQIDAPGVPLASLPTTLILRIVLQVDPDDGLETWVVDDTVQLGDSSGPLGTGAASGSRVPALDATWMFALPTDGITLVNLNAGNCYVWLGFKSLPTDPNAYDAPNWTFTKYASGAWQRASDNPTYSPNWTPASWTQTGSGLDKRTTGSGVIGVTANYVGAGSAPPFVLVSLHSTATVGSAGYSSSGSWSADDGLGSPVSGSGPISTIQDDDTVTHVLTPAVRHDLTITMSGFSDSVAPGAYNFGQVTLAAALVAPETTTLKVDSVALSYEGSPVMVSPTIWAGMGRRPGAAAHSIGPNRKVAK